MSYDDQYNGADPNAGAWGNTIDRLFMNWLIGRRPFYVSPRRWAGIVRHFEGGFWK